MSFIGISEQRQRHRPRHMSHIARNRGDVNGDLPEYSCIRRISEATGMFTLLNNRLRLSLAGRVTLLEQALDKHFEDYELDRERARVMNEQMLHRLDEQDAQVLRLHKANQESDAKIIEAVQQLQGSTNTFDQLLPSIKNGIEADARRQYRRKGVQRIAAAIVSTIVFISALIPLAQLLLGLQITIHAG